MFNEENTQQEASNTEANTTNENTGAATPPADQQAQAEGEDLNKPEAETDQE